MRHRAPTGQSTTGQLAPPAPPRAGQPLPRATSSHQQRPQQRIPTPRRWYAGPMHTRTHHGTGYMDVHIERGGPRHLRALSRAVAVNTARSRWPLQHHARCRRWWRIVLNKGTAAYCRLVIARSISLLGRCAARIRKSAQNGAITHQPLPRRRSRHSIQTKSLCAEVAARRARTEIRTRPRTQTAHTASGVRNEWLEWCLLLITVCWSCHLLGRLVHLNGRLELLQRKRERAAQHVSIHPQLYTGENVELCAAWVDFELGRGVADEQAVARISNGRPTD